MECTDIRDFVVSEKIILKYLDYIFLLHTHVHIYM